MTPESIKEEYRSKIDQVGETIAIRRYFAVGHSPPYFDVEARARVTGYEPNELVGSVLQGDRRIILLADDLVDTDLTLPLTTNDKIVVRSKELALKAVDDSSRRFAGVLIAYELQARG